MPGDPRYRQIAEAGMELPRVASRAPGHMPSCPMSYWPREELRNEPRPCDSRRTGRTMLETQRFRRKALAYPLAYKRG